MIDFFKPLLCSSNIDWTATGTIIIAFSTILVAGIAWNQLGKTNKISKADFDQRFKTDFFNENTTQLFMLFQYDLLVFKTEPVTDIDDEFPYFEVNLKQFATNPIFAGIKDRYSAYEIDNLLLGHFEDLGLFCEKRLMDIDFIYEGFGYYIEEIHENEQIQNYLCWSREEENEESDTFDKFDDIFKKVKRHGERKHKKLKIKKFICRHWK
jgi:hypothetical protein